MRKRLKFHLLLSITVIAITPVFAQQVTGVRVVDKLQPSVSVSMNGFVGGKLDDSYTNRIVAQDAGRLIEPFRNRTEERCWQTEFWGKWMTSAVLAYSYKPTAALKQVMDKAVTALLTTQTADGYIGNYADSKHLEQWDVWGRKYCMLGLVAYYDITKDTKALQGACRVADHLIKELYDKRVQIVSKGNHRGMAASSVLEPITQLYVRTGNKKYFQFAQEIVDEWESPAGPKLISKADINVAERFPVPEKNWFGYEQGQKAYEMMSCYEGLLEFYRITGKAEYKTAVEKVWQNIYDTEINIVGSGSSMECWFGGKNLQTQVSKHYQETCVTATWIKLSQQLLRLTGQAKYADAIEKTLYNSLLGSMKPDASTWAKYSPVLGIRSEGEDQCNMGLNCCVASGPRGLFTIPLTTVMKSTAGIWINFFNPGTYTVNTPAGQAARVIQTTDFPVKDKVSIRLNLGKGENFTLYIRIPGWSKHTVLTINDKQQQVSPGEYVAITRQWNSNDDIELIPDMRARVEHIEGVPSYDAITRGPIVLARDNRMKGGADVDEIITPLLDKDGYVQLKEAVQADDKMIWMHFDIPCMAGSYRAEASGKPVNLTFCDYASAGNTYTEDSRFRIWFPQLLDPAMKHTKE